MSKKKDKHESLNLGIAEDQCRAIADGLSRLLADTYTLYLKTHNFHWNVTGPQFSALHTMFETQYTELALAVDLIAERIRALGEPAPGSYSAFARLSTIKEATDVPAATDMVRILAEDQLAVVRTARSVFPLADAAHDEPTADLLTQRITRRVMQAGNSIGGAISADGTAMAIWRERNPGDSNYSLKAARYVPGAGGWQAPVTIDGSFDTVSPLTAPRVAMDAAGNAIAVWHQGESLYHNVFRAGTGWGTAVQVDANALSSSFTARIRLAMTASGRAVVVWRSGIFALKSMQYAPGSGFSAPVEVNGYGLDAELGLDADGNAVVVYTAPDRWPAPTTGLDLYSRRLAWGGSWSEAVAIEPKDGLGVDGFAAFNREGQGVAAWVRGDVAGSSTRKSLWVNLLR